MNEEDQTASQKLGFESMEPLTEGVGGFNDYSSLDGKFADNYIRQYYAIERGVPSDEHIVADHLIPFLRANHSKGICLDPATGPTCHHQVFLSRYFDKLHCGDYLSDNRRYVEKFAEADPSALSWEHYAAFYLEKEGLEVNRETISELIQSTRRKIGTEIHVSNIMTRPVVKTGIQYDAVSCFYCLEEVAKSEEELCEVIGNAASQIRPGGAFIASVLANSDFYLLKNADGSEVVIPCLRVSSEILLNALQEARLEVPENGLILRATEGQASEGLPGILVVYARKSVA